MTTRTFEEVLTNPQDGDKIPGTYLGKTTEQGYWIWSPCPKCGVPIWRLRSAIHKVCYKCWHIIALERYEKTAIERVRNPQEGCMVKGRFLSLSARATYVWHTCPECKKGRWLRYRRDITRGSTLCGSCRQRGDKSPLWKGGLYKNRYGYVLTRPPPRDPYYSMVDSQGSVMEHRYIMAKHLGRCLENWEVVHHKNGVRDDNRLENLELVIPKEHVLYTKMQREIRKLSERVKHLEEKEKLHTWLLKTLNGIKV